MILIWLSTFGGKQTTNKQLVIFPESGLALRRNQICCLLFQWPIGLNHARNKIEIPMRAHVIISLKALMRFFWNYTLSDLAVDIDNHTLWKIVLIQTPGLGSRFQKRFNGSRAKADVTYAK